MSGDYKGSIANFDATIKLNPKYTSAYYNRAVSKGILGMHKEAIVDYNATLKLDPKQPEAYYNRGISRVNVSDTKGACSDFDTAIKMGYAAAKEMKIIYCGKI
jgi:lipoprotein NlpI